MQFRNVKKTEISEQIALVEWCWLQYRLKLVHAANEGKRSVWHGKLLKRAGLSKGFPDLFLPKAIKPHHGLFIELKSEKGRPTPSQIEWLKTLNLEGYKALLCYGFEEGQHAIEDYLNL